MADSDIAGTENKAKTTVFTKKKNLKTMQCHKLHFQRYNLNVHMFNRQKKNGIFILLQHSWLKCQKVKLCLEFFFQNKCE